VKTVERTIGGETKQVEWIGGFDAKPYMESASWGEPKYKKVSDPDTSQKVYHGDGCKVHPAKKATLKFQGESDPDSKVNTGLHKSTRAAVAVIRPKGSDYLPVIEAGSLAKVAPIKPDNLEEIPALPTFAGISDGISAYGSGYWSKLSAHKESAEYKQAERAQREARARNEARENEYAEELRAGIVAEDTAEFAYKRFRLLASDLVESAKREGITPQKFYDQNRGKLELFTQMAARKSGISWGELWRYIKNNAPKFYAACFGPQDAKPAPKPRKRVSKPKAKAAKLEDMTTGELQQERNAVGEEMEKLGRRYSRIMGELLSREDPNIWRDQTDPDPDPDPGENAPAPKGDTVKISEAVEMETAGALPVETKAQKRAAMREAKAARKAQRREWRKRQRAEARAV
jgi:hypothetical protein